MSEPTESEQSAFRAPYVIRPYEPGDKAAVLSLYDDVFGGGSEAWFDWKYEDNPYLPEVPIFVAERDGVLVGARPYLAFRMHAGNRTAVALQTADTMVSPDHRRQGLFTRMTERSFEYYRDRDPAFTFNIPNALSRSGYLDLGCEVVSELETHYRIQDPATLTAERTDGTVAQSVAAVATPFVRGYLRLRGGLASSRAGFTVREHATIPVSELASVYERHVPDRLHAVRDETFYAWRFRNPEWDYRAFTAHRDREPVAGIVTGSQSRGGRTFTRLTDVVPLIGNGDRDAAIEALLAHAVDVHGESDLIATAGRAIPQRIRRRFGFYGDDSLPFSHIATPTVLITSPLGVGPDAWSVGGLDIRQPDSWLLSFSEQNTS